MEKIVLDYDSAYTLNHNINKLLSNIEHKNRMGVLNVHSLENLSIKFLVPYIKMIRITELKNIKLEIGNEWVSLINLMMETK